MCNQGGEDQKHGVPSVDIYQLQPAFAGLRFHSTSDWHERASSNELENFVCSAQRARQRSVDVPVEVVS